MYIPKVAPEKCRTERKKDTMEEIYELVSKIALERIRKEKATRLKRKTLKLIALTERLYKTIFGNF